MSDEKGCAVEGCAGGHFARGWCRNCYLTQRAKVDPGYRAKRMAAADRRRTRARAEAAAYRELRERGLLP